MKSSNEIAMGIFSLLKCEFEFNAHTWNDKEVQTLVNAFNCCFETEDERISFMMENGWKEFYNRVIKK